MVGHCQGIRLVALVKVKAIKRSSTAWYRLDDILTMDDYIYNENNDCAMYREGPGERGIYLRNCIVLREREEYPTISTRYEFADEACNGTN